MFNLFDPDILLTLCCNRGLYVLDKVIALVSF